MSKKMTHDELTKLAEEAEKRGDPLMASTFFALAGVRENDLDRSWAAMLGAFIQNLLGLGKGKEEKNDEQPEFNPDPDPRHIDPNYTFRL